MSRTLIVTLVLFISFATTAPAVEGETKREAGSGTERSESERHSDSEAPGRDLTTTQEQSDGAVEAEAEGAAEGEETLEPEEIPWVVPETLDYHLRREQLREAGLVRSDQTKGGLAMIGLTIMGPNHRVHDGLPFLAQAKHPEWDGWGAFVADVLPTAPADLAGLQPGDVVVKYAGLWVESYRTLIYLSSRSDVDREYELLYLRDGEVFKTWLMPKHAEEVLPPKEEESKERPAAKAKPTAGSR